jgi:hypothetical protein
VQKKKNETHVINNLLQSASLLPKRQHQHPKSICCYRLPAHGGNWRFELAENQFGGKVLHAHMAGCHKTSSLFA